VKLIVGPLEAKIAVLEAKNSALETKTAVLEAETAELKATACTFKGAFSRGVYYKANSLVMFRGILWVAAQDCQAETPAEGGSWVMATKHSSETMRQVPPLPPRVVGGAA
jgi:hypothetical protein